MKNIEKQLNSKEAKRLYRAITALDNEKDVVSFLRDLLTMEEIEEAIRRFDVAKMLTDKKTFREITQKTQMSSTTIARINYWLNHGTGGYRIALERLTEGSP